MWTARERGGRRAGAGAAPRALGGLSGQPSGLGGVGWEGRRSRGPAGGGGGMGASSRRSSAAPGAWWRGGWGARTQERAVRRRVRWCQGRPRTALAVGTAAHTSPIPFCWLTGPCSRNRKEPGVGSEPPAPLPLAFLCPSDAGLAPTRPRLLLCPALDPAPHPPLSPPPLPLPPGALPF